jgi:Prolipoprotein diacylglyceryl transferase
MSYQPDIFAIVLLLLLTLLLNWACRTLPKEKWQFFAVIPRTKQADGFWDSRNFTWYGALSAVAFMLASSLVVLLTSTININPTFVITSFVSLTAISLLASKHVARLVERMHNTFTIGGAVFVVVLVAPWLLVGCNLLMPKLGLGASLNKTELLALLSAIAVAYVYGEGIGRIACISFGCCYGKRVDNLTGFSYQVFSRLNFVFYGSTKKIAYAAAMEGVAVVPIQAITSFIYFVTGTIGFCLFMRGHYASALVIVMLISQGWRFTSEFMRADFRGAGKITAYQWMAALTAVLCVMYAVYFYQAPGVIANPMTPSLEQGLIGLWSPGNFIFVQLIGLYIFWTTGKSTVTRSRMAMYLATD